MNLKEYREQPDSGLFEKIERRLRLRRLVRRGAAVCGVAAVAAGVWLAVASHGGREEVSVAQAGRQGLPAAESVSAAAPVTRQESLVRQETMADVHPGTDGVRKTAEVGRPTVDAGVTATPAGQAAVATAEAAVQQPVAAASGAAPVRQAVAVKPADEDVRAPGVGEAGNETVADLQPEAGEPLAAKESDPGSVPVHIDNLFWAPNVIVPSDEVEKNRVFKLFFSSTVTDFRIQIYNRGGRLLYTGTDPDFEWDGTHNGTQLPQGAYVWVAKFRDTDGSLHQERGTVTILR